MTKEQEDKCHTIIHSHAVSDGIGNAIPIPGLDIAADIATLTSMTISLGNVFGQPMDFDTAKDLIFGVLRKQVVGRVGKELFKLIPIVGWIASPVIGVAMTESTGWEIAKKLSYKSEYAG